MKRKLRAALVAAFVLFATAGAWAAPSAFGPYKFTAVTLLVPSRGVNVPAVFTVPEKAGSLPLVVMAHGHGGSKEENGGFTAIAEALAARGVASVRMALPGCGASSEPFTANTVSSICSLDLEAWFAPM